MKRFDELAFHSDVASIGWNQLITETNGTNALFNHWSYAFALTIDKHTQIFEKGASGKYCPSINKELKE